MRLYDLHEWQDDNLYHVTSIPSALSIWQSDSIGHGNNVSTTRSYDYALGYLKNMRHSGVIFCIDQKLLRQEIGRRRLPPTDWFKGEPPETSRDEFQRRSAWHDTDRFETLIKGGVSPFRKYVRKIEIWLPVNQNLVSQWTNDHNLGKVWRALISDPRTEIKNELEYQRRRHGLVIPVKQQYDQDHPLYDPDRRLDETEESSNTLKIFRKLRELGYENIGSGGDSTVWAKDEDKVIKILMPSRTIPSRALDADRGFLTFYNFCKHHSELPNLPKFINIGGEHHTVFVLNGVSYRQIAMERLKPIDSNSFEQLMVWILSDVAKIRASWASVVKELKMSETWKLDPSMSDMPRLVTEKFSDSATYKQYGILYQTMCRLYHIGLKNGLGWDLHTENVMQRRDGTLVIIDPYFT